MYPEPLTPIMANDEVARMHERLSNTLQRVSKGEYALMKRDRWTAVPCESGYHFSQDDEERIIKAIPQTDCLYACTMETLHEFPSAFIVQPTIEGIHEFNNKTAHFNFALFPEELSWLILCTTDEYFLVAGTADFVRIVVGEELDEAFIRFKDFAERFNLQSALSERLFSVLKAFYDEYNHADEGAFVSFP